MNILLTHVYSPLNAGDKVLTEATLESLRNRLPRASFTVLSADPEREILNEKIYPSFFFWALYSKTSVFARVFRTFYLIIITPMLISKSRRLQKIFLLPVLMKTLNHYQNADIVVAVAGGYLNSRKSLKSALTLILQLQSIYLATKLQKPTWLYNQSIGPFRYAWQKKLVAHVLNATSGVCVRESLSFNYLLKIGVSPKLMIQTSDVVFLYKPRPSVLPQYIESFFNKGDVVGISVRNWLDKEAQAIFETEIAKFTDELTSLGRKVVLVPQVSSSLHNDDDRVVQSRVFAKLLKPQNCLNIQEVLSADEIWNIFSRCNLVVGTRMHAVLFALCSGVPALALAYERKTWGVMQDLGLEAYVLDMEKVTTQGLLDLYTVLCDNIDSYIKQLQLAIPKQESLARLSAEVIFREYPKTA